MANYSAKGVSSNGSVYVCNLPPGTDEDMLAEFFGTIGLLKKDKRTGKPKIWLYHDKVTNEPKGDATVTYEDPYAARAAVEWFNNKEFHGNIIEVLMAQSKNSHNTVAPSGDSTLVNDEPDDSGRDMSENGARGRGRGDASGNISQKARQQDGDWMCPNTSARPAGASGGGAGGGGRGRGQGGGPDSGGGRGGIGGPTSLFGPNDWSCPMCANINWAKRLKCNICNTNKPGVSEGGVRGGRAGGYKELDEEELEETKRRRREAEEDDGEMYDEFGNLKKKFRVKAQQAEVGQVLPGTGRAGWEVEELGMGDRDRGERSRDKREDRETSKNRRRSRSHERDRGRDRDYTYDREYGRDRHSTACLSPACDPAHAIRLPLPSCNRVALLSRTLLHDTSHIPFRPAPSRNPLPPPKI